MALDAAVSTPTDPVGEAVVRFIGELIPNATVDLRYESLDEPPSMPAPPSPAITSASAEVVPGWRTTISVGLRDRGIATIESVPDALLALPNAALRAAKGFRHLTGDDRLSPSVERALRDTVVVELLGQHQGWFDPACAPTELLADTLEYLIELGGARVESRRLTHGVVITDAIADEPRLSVPYPAGLRDAKRSPLLFDGQRAVLLVDQHGRARTELQAHRPDRLHPSTVPMGPIDREFVDSGSLVGQVTRQLGGIGFFLREDRSIWTFLDGQPLVIRRSEHWSAFPLWLARTLGSSIIESPAVDLVVQASLLVSIREGGAIFGIVDEPADLGDVVPAKDRFDLRDEYDVDAMRPETRLHHLIDGGDVDAQTLARLGQLDGATIVDRNGRLISYGAILTSSDSQHEGARTAAAKSLSQLALVALKVSEDGDITVFRGGHPKVTLLPSGSIR